MFRIRRERNGLVNSRLFDEHSFYKAMSLDLKTARHDVLVETPFITVRRSREIALLFEKIIRKGVMVEVHTRNPNHHDHDLKQQAQLGIKLLEKSGVKVIVHNDMRHRKAAVIDNNILWEGSLNMLSHSNSREIMRRTVSDELCKEMLQLLI